MTSPNEQVISGNDRSRPHRSTATEDPTRRFPKTYVVTVTSIVCGPRNKENITGGQADLTATREDSNTKNSNQNKLLTLVISGNDRSRPHRSTATEDPTRRFPKTYVVTVTSIVCGPRNKENITGGQADLTATREDSNIRNSNQNKLLTLVNWVDTSVTGLVIDDVS
ncbi:hypothetical protein J6590_039749 [Homalodisca vitripennis]|nr:hypothetical protein J6590_039749 [Homalodisca vitripennis]